MKDIAELSANLLMHESSKDIVVVGLSPAKRESRDSRDTSHNLKYFMGTAGYPKYSSFNISTIPGGTFEDVDLDYVKTKIQAFKGKKIIALGRDVEKALNKVGVKDFLFINHTSRRNRFYNKFEHVLKTVIDIRHYLES